MATGGDSGLFLGQVSAVEVRLEGGFADVFLDGVLLFRGSDFSEDGVFGGDHHIGGAEKGVRPGGVDGEVLVCPVDGEVYFRAFGQSIGSSLLAFCGVR